MVIGRDWECPSPKFYNPNQGMPIENVAQVYAAADLLITTTLGEGWGLSVTEAMACGTPVLVPNHSSLQEIIGPDQARGWLIPTGGEGHTVYLGPMDNNIVRPQIHHLEMVEKMKKIIDYPNQSRRKIEAALGWVPDWKDVAPQWLEVFEEASLVDAQEEAAKVP